MKVAVVGMGSIGKRHAENIKKLGHEVVPLDLGDELRFDVDSAFICSPTKYHTNHALEYLRRDIPTFIEKPLTYDLKDLKQFIPFYKKPISMVGCNMRFHPAIRDAKALIGGSNTVFVRAEFGYYLPFWKKGDYTKSYSAGEDGGIILDAIHEIDYLYWFFGPIKHMTMAHDRVSDLEIEKEDIAEVSIIFENGVSASVHMDYLMKNYHRTLAMHLKHRTVKFTIVPTNLAYKKEVEYFLKCVKDGVQPMNGIMEASYILERVIRAKENGSDNSGKANVQKASKKSS